MSSELPGRFSLLFCDRGGHSAIKRGSALTHAAARLSLENVMLRDRSQVPRDGIPCTRSPTAGKATDRADGRWPGAGGRATAPKRGAVSGADATADGQAVPCVSDSSAPPSTRLSTGRTYTTSRRRPRDCRPGACVALASQRHPSKSNHEKQL